MTARSLGHHQGARRSEGTRSETRVRCVNPGEIAGFKKSLLPCSQLQLNCDALGQADCPTRRAKAVYQSKHDNHKLFDCTFL